MNRLIRCATAALLVLATPAASSAQQLCPRILGSWPSGGEAFGLAVSGHLAYYGSGNLLAIADISSPWDPVKLGAAELPGRVVAVAVTGHHAAVIDVQQYSDAGLRIVDVSDPEAPELLGGVALPVSTPGESPQAMTAEGSTAFIPTSEGLLVVDFSAPHAPSVVAQVLESTAGVALDWPLAFVTGTEGLKVLDVSVPSAPVEIGYSGFALRSSVIALSGSTAYVKLWERSIGIFDVSDPTQPVRLTSPWYIGDHEDFALSGHELHVISQSRGLEVVDVSDPYHPTVMGTNASIAGWTSDLEVVAAGGATIVVDETRMAIFDTFNPWNPVEIASFQKGWLSPRSAVVDGYAYVADGRSLVVLNMVDTTWPSPTGSLDLPQSASALDVGLPGETVLVSTGPTLSIVDVADPTRPRVVGGLEHGDERVDAIEVSGHLAYLAGRSLLQVVDISDPAAPTLVGAVETEPCGDVVVRGGHAYLACSYYNGTCPCGSLVIVDVSDPTSPVEVGRYQQSGARSLDLTGDLAYLGYDWCGCFNCSWGYLVIDISDATGPRLVAETIEPDWYVAGLTIQGRYAFGVSTRSLRVLDISVPADIVEAGHLQLAEWPHSSIRDLDVADGLAYVTVSSRGLAVVDPISMCHSPRRPARVVAP